MKRFNKLGSLAILCALAGFSASASGAATYALTYKLGPNGNVTSISDQGVLGFPLTPVNTTNSATFTIQNTGNSDGKLVSVVCSLCSPFDVSGLPALPPDGSGSTITAGSTLTFTVNFSPKSRGTFTTSALAIKLDSTTTTIGLSGIATGPALTVQNLSTSPFSQIATDGSGVLAFPATNSGQTASATIQIQNTGDTAVTITDINAVSNVAGEKDFTLANLVIPQNGLQPGQSVIFNVVFSPTKTVGSLTGQMVVASPTVGFTINLTGTGVGPNLIFSFKVGSQTTQIPSDGSQALLFPNTPVGSKVTGTFTIANTGNAAGSVTSVSVTSPGYTFTTASLPVTIPAGGSTTVNLIFAPTSASTINGTLAIDNLAFPIRGVGVTPQAIPTYSFTGVGDTSAALQQPSIGLTLGTAYPFDLSGKLTLTFSTTSFGDDSSIQFSTGGRTVSFTIPAGSKAATFGQNATSVQFQTGSVAGTIAITPSFSIGTVDLTPPQPLAKSVVLAAGAPQLQKVAIGARSASSFELLITGYSTPRTLSSITLNFTQAQGKSLQTSSLSLDASTAFTSWYQSAASTATGSQFTASVTINVSGDASAVQSVSVTATNSQGASGPVSVSLQ